MKCFGLCSVFGLCFGCIRQRHLMAFMAFTGITISYMARNCISLAITEIANTARGNNSTPCVVNDEVFLIDLDVESYNWDQWTQCSILGSFYSCYFITLIFGRLLVNCFGSPCVFGIGILLTHITNLVTPIAASVHYSVVIATRVISGLSSGLLVPSLSVLFASWIPLYERPAIGTLMFGANHLGNILALLISAIMIPLFGWPWLFYFVGALGVVWFVIFIITVSSEPDTHPYIRESENDYLSDAIEDGPYGRGSNEVSIFKVISSFQVWVLVICQFGFNWGLLTMRNFLPSYLRNVLKYGPAKNGFLSSLPFAALWASAIISSWIKDFLVGNLGFSSGITRKIFTIISQTIPGLLWTLAVYVGCSRSLSLVLFIIGMIMLGPSYVSMKVFPVAISPHHAEFIHAFTNGLGSLAGVYSSAVVGSIVRENSFFEWKIVFWILFAIMAVTGIFFFICSRDELQSWETDLTPSTSSEDSD